MILLKLLHFDWLHGKVLRQICYRKWRHRYDFVSCYWQQKNVTGFKKMLRVTKNNTGDTS